MITLFFPVVATPEHTSGDLNEVSCYFFTLFYNYVRNVRIYVKNIRNLVGALLCFIRLLMSTSVWMLQGHELKTNALYSNYIQTCPYMSGLLSVLKNQHLNKSAE